MISIKFNKIEELRERILKIEIKISTEQRLIAYMKAEKIAADYLIQENENTSWRSWLPGMFKGGKKDSN